MTRGCVDDPPCIREHPLRLFKVVDLRSWGPRNNPSENESSLRPNIGICGQLEQVQSPKNMSIASYTPPIMYIPTNPINQFNSSFIWIYCSKTWLFDSEKSDRGNNKSEAVQIENVKFGQISSFVSDHCNI